MIPMLSIVENERIERIERADESLVVHASFSRALLTVNASDAVRVLKSRAKFLPVEAYPQSWLFDLHRGEVGALVERDAAQNVTSVSRRICERK